MQSVRVSLPMRGGRTLLAHLSTLAAVTMLLVGGCGGSSHATSTVAHTMTPTHAARTAILRVIDSAFFSTSGAPPDLRITSLQEVGAGSTQWARATFAATPKAPASTQQGLANGHNRGLLRHAGSGDWTWLGYLAPGASCRRAGRSTPDAVARLLGLPPACPSTATPNPTPPAASTGRATTATLSSGDLATLLSIFITIKNSGPAGQVLTPSTIQLSASAPPKAASVPGGTEWALVTYVPAPGAPEPLTAMQLQDGQGTGFFVRQPGQSWVLRGLAGQPFCTGASAAHVPPSVLSLWGHAC